MQYAPFFFESEEALCHTHKYACEIEEALGHMHIYFVEHEQAL